MNKTVLVFLGIIAIGATMTSKPAKREVVVPDSKSSSASRLSRWPMMSWPSWRGTANAQRTG